MVWSAASSVAMGGLCKSFAEDCLYVNALDMPLKHLGKELEGLRLVHISDLHSSPLVSQRYLRHCVERVNDLRPDVVILTGDFISGLQHYARKVGDVLSALQPNITSLAVLGNHDYGRWHPGSGGSPTLADYTVGQLEDAGIRVLRNEVWQLKRSQSKVQFLGLEDLWSGRFDPARTFASAHADVPSVALCHNPMAAAELTARGAQWVLAGHTHGYGGLGTSMHEIMRPPADGHLLAGLYKLDGGFVYVNRGLGHGRRRHLSRRPEITLFTLKKSPLVQRVAHARGK